MRTVWIWRSSDGYGARLVRIFRRFLLCCNWSKQHIISSVRCTLCVYCCTSLYYKAIHLTMVICLTTDLGSGRSGCKGTCEGNWCQQFHDYKDRAAAPDSKNCAGCEPSGVPSMLPTAETARVHGYKGYVYIHPVMHNIMSSYDIGITHSVFSS